MTATLAFKHKVSKNTSMLDRFYILVTQVYTKSKYYHVDLIVKDKYYSSSPDHAGVFARPLEPLKPEYDYITIDIDGRRMKSFHKVIDTYTGKGYDWWGIFLGYGLRLGVDHRDKFFCSEIVTELLKTLNVPEVKDMVPLTTSPVDLWHTFKHYK